MYLNALHNHRKFHDFLHMLREGTVHVVFVDHI